MTLPVYHPSTNTVTYKSSIAVVAVDFISHIKDTHYLNLIIMVYSIPGLVKAVRPVVFC